MASISSVRAQGAIGFAQGAIGFAQGALGFAQGALGLETAGDAAASARATGGPAFATR
jgi:hypothetical protein